MSDLLSSYSSYMSSIFGDNQMVIAVFTTFIIGITTYLLKVIPSFTVKLLLKYYSVTVKISSNSNAYHAFAKLIPPESLKQSKFLTITNGLWGHNKSVIGLGEGVQIIKLYGEYVVVTLNSTITHDTVLDVLTFRSYGRTHTFANRLTHELNYEENSDKLKIIHTDKPENIIHQKKELISSMIMTDYNMSKYNNIMKFKNNEERYAQLDMHYKFGILLYGPPGTGKTKFVRVLASELDYTLVSVSNIADMSRIPKTDRVIVYIDEIDRVLNNKMTLNDKEVTVGDGYKVGYILSQLDGIEQPHGRIVVMSTNNRDSLDPALVRSGRIDIEINMDYVNSETFLKFLEKYYSGDNFLPSNLELQEKLSMSDLENYVKQGKSYEEVLSLVTVRI